MKKTIITLFFAACPFVAWSQTDAVADTTTTIPAAELTPAQLNMSELMSNWRTEMNNLGKESGALFTDTKTDVNYNVSAHGDSEKDFFYSSITQYKASKEVSLKKVDATTKAYNTIKEYADALKADPSYKTDQSKKDEYKIAKMHMRTLKSASKTYTKEVKHTDKLINLLMKRYDVLQTPTAF